MPSTPCWAPQTRSTPWWRRASRTTPTRDWLITAVGPPPWATRILPEDMDAPALSEGKPPRTGAGDALQGTVAPARAQAAASTAADICRYLTGWCSCPLPRLVRLAA